jgi:hypothetical protein
VEAVCWCGFDNFGIPLVGAAALSTLVSWSLEELATRSAVLLACAAGACFVVAARFTRTILPIAPC